MKTIKILKSSAGILASYTAGEIIQLKDKEAHSLVKAKIAEYYNPLPSEKVNVQQNETENKDENKLPEDCPARDLLIKAGLTTVDDVLNHEDLTLVKGIGDATAKEILEFLQ